MYVTRFQAHVEPKLVGLCDFLVEVEELSCLGVEGPEICVLVDRPEVVTVKECPELAIEEPARWYREVVDVTVSSRVEVHGLEETLDEVRPSGEQLVEDADGADDDALCAARCGSEAEQTYWVGSVAVEGEASYRPVTTRVPIRVVLTDVAHMSEQVAVAVLRAGNAQVEAEAPEEALAPFLAPRLDRQAAKEHEAPPVLHFPPPACDVLFQRAEREVDAPHPLHRD